MAVQFTFVTHATSLDNEAGIASGHFDVALSATGREQAAQRRDDFAGQPIDAVFSSDLQRASETVRIAFGDRDVPLIEDVRLRECDYGELTGRPSEEIAAARPQHIDVPFPGGESYAQIAAGMRSLLDEIAATRESQRIVIVGHRATQDCLEHLANGVPLAETISLPWAWQPMWDHRYSPDAVVTP